MAVFTIKEHPDYIAALAKRGIDDLDKVQIDPWPAGVFGYEAEAGRRISRCISFLREHDADNGYARPDRGADRPLRHGPRRGGRGGRPRRRRRCRRTTPATTSASVGPLRTGLKPLEITQPEGPSFTVTGNLVEWQNWSLRVAFDPYEGLVLHQVGYEDGGRVRPILHRASITEMVVPYGIPGEAHGWKNAFDAGEWGLGRMTQSLELGCDCLGEIPYLDATFSNEQGEPWVIENAICLHEEDVGISWKHVDLWSGTHEVRRNRRMVVSFISTVGNYEYGFYWYLYVDGTIQLEVKLTGIMSPMAFDPAGPPPERAVVVAPGVAAPVHQHLFCARLDLDVDGAANRVEEVDVVARRARAGQPVGQRVRPGGHAARPRVGGPADDRRRPSRRAWKVTNPDVRNGLGQPVAYKLNPTMATPSMLAGPASSVARRAAFARHNLWVTPYSPEERRPAGEYPNQHDGGDGLPAWTEADRDLTDTDVVLWYSFGVTHVPRPEDWPVMPVELTGFLLQPVGFFDRNPALDLPPPQRPLPPGVVRRTGLRKPPGPTFRTRTGQAGRGRGSRRGRRRSGGWRRARPRRAPGGTRT